jgi:hypothetical protein
VSVVTPPRRPRPDDPEAIIAEARRRQRLRRGRIVTAAALVVGAGVALLFALGGRGDNGGVSVGDPLPAPARSGYELALARAVTGNPPRREIIVVDAEGTRARVVAGGGALFGSRPAWSPDGEKLALTAVTGRTGDEDEEELSDVLIVDADGSNRRRLTRSGRAAAPLWSPDGRTIVFAEREPGPRFPPRVGPWAVDVDGTNRRRLTEPERGRMEIPSSFSPDGSKLAFTRVEWAPLGPEGRVQSRTSIALLDLASLDVEILQQRAENPAFSPDGRRIAFVSDRDQNGELSYGDAVQYANELYVMDADGSNARRLTYTRDLTERAPSWSPDGRLIAFQRGQRTGNAEGGVVLVIRSDGSCTRRVAFDRGLGVWYQTPVFRPASAIAEGGLACRPSRPPRPLAVEPSGNLGVEGARRFRRFGLYWVGRQFDGFVLSSISSTPSTGLRGRQTVVDVQYGGFDIQLWHACTRVPADVAPSAGPRQRVRIRGVEGVFFEGGVQLQIVTGKTTVVIFGEREQIVRVARVLRPLNPAFAPRARGGDLPPPAPGATAGRLRCG